MRAGPPAAPGLPARGAALPALRGRDSLVSAGRRGPHGVLVPGLPGRNGPREGVTVPRVRPGFRSQPPRRGHGQASALARALHRPARLLPGRLLRPRDGARRRCGHPDRPRGARRPEPADPLRVPASRRLVRRAARRPTCAPRGRARGTVGAQGRARRRHLRQRPRRRADRRGRGSPAHDPHPTARSHGRDARRLRLGRRRLRARLRRARTLAVRRPPFLRRRHARSSG